MTTNERRPQNLPSPQSRVLDQAGHLDPQWTAFIQSLLDEIRRLRAISDDHEQRITTLEP